jgi:hypothetical protein
MGLDDEMKRIQAAQDAMKRATDPLGGYQSTLAGIGDIRSILAGPSSISATLASAQDHLKLHDTAIGTLPRLQNLDTAGILTLASESHEYARLLSGPMHDIRRLGLLDEASIRRTDVTVARIGLRVDPVSLPGIVETATSELARYENQFRLPDMAEATTLSRVAIGSSSIVSALARSEATISSITTAMQSMHSPWLLRDHATQSARAFTEIQAIGRAIGTEAPFDTALTSSLRSALGDWRGVTSIPAPVFEDVVARTDFYVGLGLNPALTDFTAQAFYESSRLAGLGQREDEDEADEEETGLLRTNRAHDQFLRFERQVRRDIDELMTAEFGADWMKHQVPDGMLDHWNTNKAIAISKGEEEQPLLNYAEFSHYLQIIELKENWNRVFKPIFKRRSDVQESFVRLFPVRNCTMHARLITLDDELLLRVESRRIIRAFSRHA